MEPDIFKIIFWSKNNKLKLGSKFGSFISVPNHRGVLYFRKTIGADNGFCRSGSGTKINKAAAEKAARSHKPPLVLPL
jgi:hypothetical protein